MMSREHLVRNFSAYLPTNSREYQRLLNISMDKLKASVQSMETTLMQERERVESAEKKTRDMERSMNSAFGVALKVNEIAAQMSLHAAVKAKEAIQKSQQASENAKQTAELVEHLRACR